MPVVNVTTSEAKCILHDAYFSSGFCTALCSMLVPLVCFSIVRGFSWIRIILCNLYVLRHNGFKHTPTICFFFVKNTHCPLSLVDKNFKLDLKLPFLRIERLLLLKLAFFNCIFYIKKEKKMRKMNQKKGNMTRECNLFFDTNVFLFFLALFFDFNEKKPCTNWMYCLFDKLMSAFCLIAIRFTALLINYLCEIHVHKLNPHPIELTGTHITQPQKFHKNNAKPFFSFCKRFHRRMRTIFDFQRIFCHPVKTDRYNTEWRAHLLQIM